jgi:hypothetical protein
MSTTTLTIRADRATQRLAARVRHIRWRIRDRLRRYGIAWRYAMDTSTQHDGYALRDRGEELTGWYAIEGLSEASVADAATLEFRDSPQLDGLIMDACQRVASKWNSDGEIGRSAVDWAMDLIREQAADNGIESLPEDAADAHDQDR